MKQKTYKIAQILIITGMIICGIYKLCQESYAASGSSNASASDVQLIARAINGEARGESYEGQVAVRSRNPK